MGSVESKSARIFELCEKKKKLWVKNYFFMKFHAMADGHWMVVESFQKKKFGVVFFGLPEYPITSFCVLENKSFAIHPY